MSGCLTELLPDLGRLGGHWAGLRVAWGPHVHNLQWMKALDMGTVNFPLAKTCMGNTQAARCTPSPSEEGSKRKKKKKVGLRQAGGHMRCFIILWEGSKLELVCASPPFGKHSQKSLHCADRAKLAWLSHQAHRGLGDYSGSSHMFLGWTLCPTPG